MKYSHIFFDYHGVLSHSTYWSNIPEFQIIERQWFGEHKALLKDWAKGQCNVDKFIGSLAETTGIDAGYLRRTLKESCATQVFPVKGIPNLIRKLQARGIVCIIATDNYDIFNDWIVPSLGLDKLFDYILNSYNLKHLKTELDGKFSPFFSPYINTHTVKKALWLDDNDLSYQAKSLGMNFKLVKHDDNLVALVEDMVS